MNETLPGGMMGGYLAEDFPFYYINRQMLDYLGYKDEAEFVADIQGKIINCMHPDDRTRVDKEVGVQLEKGHEYTVEYRMKRQDGTYIWVHDLAAGFWLRMAVRPSPQCATISQLRFRHRKK
ncbi:MAG: PAS domain-containing protein [Holdemania massiliensis]